MIEFNTKTDTPRKIIIPVSNQQDVLRYQQGLLGILSKIELSSMGPALKEDVKTVYLLLDHMQFKDNLAQLLEAERLRAPLRKKAKPQSSQRRRKETRRKKR